MNVGRLWELWLEDRADDGFDNAIYRAQWVALKPAFANRMPHLLTTKDYRDYARARFAAGRSQWTVHNDLRRIRACLKWAFEQGHVAKLPKVWVPQAGKHRERVLTADEARALVLGARQGDPHMFLFVVLAFATGARHAAILDLMWDRVDFIKGLIVFDENLPPDPMSKSWRKGRATVLMSRVARAALERAYAGRLTDFVIEHGGRRLVTVKTGFRNAVERAGLGAWEEKAGKRRFVTDVTPHTIRHTVLTWLDEGKIEAKRAAQLAGHRDERTTKLVYTHASPEVLRDAIDLIDGVLEAKRIALKPTEPEAKRPKLSHRDKSAKGSRAATRTVRTSQPR